MGNEKMPHHYAIEYMKALDGGWKDEAKAIWASIPSHLLDMVKDHINTERWFRKHKRVGNGQDQIGQD